jgi:hypothetical protein
VKSWRFFFIQELMKMNIFKKRSGKKKEDIFFRKTDDGRDVFYPWGYPGEGIFLEGGKKRRLFLWFNAYFLFIGLCGILSILLQEFNVITNIVGQFIFLIIGMVFVPVYVFAVHFIKRGKEFLITPKEERPTKWAFLWVFVVSVGQIDGFYLYADKVPLVFLIFYGLSFLFTSYVFIKILRTRGYYFSDGRIS